MNDIGDNLIEARDFVNTAMASMDILLSDTRLNIDLAQTTLKEIQLDARTLSAKGIARAAQSVLDCYKIKCSQPKIDGRLMALYKLVTQYAEGLNEISPVISDTDIAAQQETLEESFATARETLTPLLRFAGDYTPALKRLAGLPLDLCARPAEPHFSFESLMPDVTNSALRTARTQGKSVSVSYAADGLTVASSQVEAVRGQLEDIVIRLVNTQISTPNRRAAKGLPRGGHIDISAKNTANGLDISVQCDGETVTVFPGNKLDAPCLADAVTIDMELEVGA